MVRKQLIRSKCECSMKLIDKREKIKLLKAELKRVRDLSIRKVFLILNIVYKGS